jgi:hypothetical protein
MPKTQPTPEPPVRYVLQRLPEAALEESQRQRHRALKRGNAIIFGLMLTLMAWSVGMVAFEVAYGDPSTVTMGLLLLFYAGLLAWTVFQGNVGVRGRYHQVHAGNCAIALEDDQRERYGYGMLPAVELAGIAPEDTAEYLRLLDLASHARDHASNVSQRLGEIRGDVPDPEDVASEPQVE